jgi:hypothetical protein
MKSPEHKAAVRGDVAGLAVRACVASEAVSVREA